MKEKTKKGLREFGRVMGITGIFGLVAITGIGTCLNKFGRTEKNPRLVVDPIYNSKRIEGINYSYGAEKYYIDTVPLGSLDYVIDHTSGERIERKPTQEDYETFRRMGGGDKMTKLKPSKKLMTKDSGDTLNLGEKIENVN